MIFSFVQQAVVCSNSMLMMILAVMMMMMMMTTTINNGDYFRCYTATAFVSLPTAAAAAMTRTSTTVQVLLLSSSKVATTMTMTNNNNSPVVKEEERVGQQSFNNPSTTITKTKPKPMIQYEWIPMIIQFDHVYKSYGPPSFWRKMTSSVPRREFALEDITITFGGYGRGRQRGIIRNDENESSGNDGDVDIDIDSTINLLVGASSSGKSTILKSILETDNDNETQQQQQQQTNGNNNSNAGSIHILPLQKDKMMRSSKPILLDDRNDVNNNNIDGDAKTTVQEEWTVRVIHELEKLELEEQKISKTNYDIKQQDSRQQQCNNLLFAKLLVQEMAVQVFCLDLNKLIVDMTPSEKYRLCLGQACIESSISRMELIPTNNVNNNTNRNKDDEIDNDGTSNSSTQQQQQQHQQQQQQQQQQILHYKIPGPILLLDEYMDVETSTVIQKVQPSLHRIVSKLNGIVISVTHKPNLYSSSSTSTRGGTRSIVQQVHGDDGDGDNEMQQQKQTQQKEQIVRRITLSRGKINSVN